MMKDICVYGVVDTYAERAEMFAKKYGAKSYDPSYMRYMKDKNTDIIICATYPETHLDILKQCVKYKKHLLCEKPIASNTEDAKEFVSIVKGTDIKVQIGYILRFNETYRTARQDSDYRERKPCGLSRRGRFDRTLSISPKRV